MNSPRAVLQSLPSLPPIVTQKVQILVAGILISSFIMTQAAEEQKNSTTSMAVDTIQGEDLSQLFEGFTDTLQYDSEHKTWNIGYGTDIGKKTHSWPYGEYADDVVGLMQDEGFSKDDIRDILQGNKKISETVGKKLFSMRYDRRKEMVASQYEVLYNKKFKDLPEIIQSAVVDFSYNMRGEGGIFPTPGFPGFPEACKALRDENWAQLAHEIAESKYAGQVGPRRAGYWVAQMVKLSGEPLKDMTKDVKSEVKSFKKVEPEIKRLLAQIRRDRRMNEG